MITCSLPGAQLPGSEPLVVKTLPVLFSLTFDETVTGLESDDISFASGKAVSSAVASDVKTRTDYIQVLAAMSVSGFATLATVATLLSLCGIGVMRPLLPDKRGRAANRSCRRT